MIPELRYVPAYLGAGEHDEVLRTVSGLEWQDAGGRRVSLTFRKMLDSGEAASAR